MKSILWSVLIVFCLSACSHKENNLTLQMPQQLGDLKLDKTIEGSSAKKLMYKMHKKISASENSLIGYYGAPDSKNILYVGIFNDAAKAEQDLKAMTRKMADGAQGFTPLTHTETDNIAYYMTGGLGRTHFFFRVHNIVIWWQVEPKKAEATFKDLRDFQFKVF